jgi:hypothetical protein
MTTPLIDTGHWLVAGWTMLHFLWVGGLLPRPRPSVEGLINLSKAAYEQPPAFTMEFRDPAGGTHRLASDGDGTWRIEVAGEAAGSFYLYDGEPTEAGDFPPDPRALAAIGYWSKSSQQLSPDIITARLFLPMLLEATRVLEEGIVRNPRDIDLGVIFGLGFPIARGGLLQWADMLGARRVLERLRSLESLGPRAAPTPMLLEMARRDGRFYQWQRLSDGHRRLVF